VRLANILAIMAVAVVDPVMVAALVTRERNRGA